MALDTALNLFQWDRAAMILVAILAVVVAAEVATTQMRSGLSGSSKSRQELVHRAAHWRPSRSPRRRATGAAHVAAANISAPTYVSARSVVSARALPGRPSARRTPRARLQRRDEAHRQQHQSAGIIELRPRHFLRLAVFPFQPCGRAF